MGNAMDRVFELLKHDPDTVGFSFTPADQAVADSIESVRAARVARHCLLLLRELAQCVGAMLETCGSAGKGCTFPVIV